MGTEEDKRSFRYKLVALFFLLVIVGAALLVGPFIGKVVEQVRQRRTEPDAPKYYYWLAQICEGSGRKEQALELYEEFFLNYCNDEALDYSGMPEHARKPGYNSCMPWVLDRLAEKGQERPALARELRSDEMDLLAKVMVGVSDCNWDKRNWRVCDHIAYTLVTIFPPGSYGHEEGQRLLIKKQGSGR